MNGDNKPYTVEELRFFGAVVASAAHEWGNVLAVIHESAGLLEDLACLAGRGHPLDPERLASLAGAVTRQVRRGNALLTNLRRFAHAMDTPGRAVDLAEAGATMAALAGRLASQHGVSLNVVAGGTAQVCRDPYRLCRLLHVCLIWGIETVGSGGSLEIATLASADGPGLGLSGLPEALTALPEIVRDAAAAVEASVRPEPGRLLLLFPEPA
jgi:hypothetical protein